MLNIIYVNYMKRKKINKMKLLERNEINSLRIVMKEIKLSLNL